MDTSFTSNGRGKTVKLRASTLDRIEELRHKGQSYDGVITELLDFYAAPGLAELQNLKPITKGTKAGDNV